jgi:hypothetical protein
LDVGEVQEKGEEEKDEERRKERGMIGKHN